MANVSSSIGHKELKPKLRFNGFSDEWIENELQDIFTKITQKNTNGSINNVICNSAQKGLIPQREYFDKDIANSDNTDGYFVIKKGDFVYNPRKSVSAPYGPISVYNYDDDGIVSPLYLCFRTKEAINTSFYEWYFKSSAWHRYVYLYGDSGVRHDRVSIKDSTFFEMLLHIPCDAEQQKLAHFLSLLDLLIHKQQQLVYSLKSYKRGLLRRVYSNIIDDWKEYKLSDIAKIYQPQTIASTDLIKDGAYPVYGANGCIGRYDRYNHDTEQIAICCRGASCGTVNYIPAFSWITGNAMVINIHSNIADKIFVYYCLLATDLSYMVSGSGQPQIVREPCANHKIHLPNMQTQHHIAELFSTLDKNIDAHIRTLQNLEAIKQALLQNLFI